MQDQGAAGGPVAVAAGRRGPVRRRLAGGALRGARPDRAGVRRRDRPLRQRPDRAVPRPDAGGALDASGEGLFVDGGPGAAGRPRRADRGQRRGRPDAGGAVWRLRDGLGGGGAGGRGRRRDAAGADRRDDVAARDPLGFVSQNARTGAATMASEIGSFFAGRGARSDEDRAYLVARQAALAEQETHEIGRRQRQPSSSR